jgi:hypothetical protein
LVNKLERILKKVRVKRKKSASGNGENPPKELSKNAPVFTVDQLS